MPRPDTLTLNVPTANATAGTAKDVSSYEHSAVQFAGVPAASSYKLQGSLDGTNWVDIGTAVTADAIVAVNTILMSVRVYGTTVGTPAPVVTFAGHNLQTI